jgi:hypothetical protein
VITAHDEFRPDDRHGRGQHSRHDQPADSPRQPHGNEAGKQLIGIGLD